MKCIYCGPESTEFNDQESLNMHIVADHKDRTIAAETGEAIRKAMSEGANLQVAVSLTGFVIGDKGAKVQTVWNTFREFYKRCMDI